MRNCSLKKNETIDVLQKLQNIALNELYVDKESDSVFIFLKYQRLYTFMLFIVL